jgi:hypothetical protein
LALKGMTGSLRGSQIGLYAIQTRLPTRSSMQQRGARLLHTADTIIARDVPHVPLLFYAHRNIISTKLKGFYPNPVGANETRFMQLTP